MVLSFDFIIELKKTLQENFSVYLHLHDGCGGQSFSLEQTSDDIKSFIDDYFKKHNLIAVFREDNLGFTVKKK